jgi:hypothetical protein
VLLYRRAFEPFYSAYNDPKDPYYIKTTHSGQEISYTILFELNKTNSPDNPEPEPELELGVYLQSGTTD